MIDIDNSLVVRLQSRVNKLRRAYGPKTFGRHAVSELANACIKKQLDRADHKDSNPNKNNGIKWAEFKAAHFRQIYQRDGGRCTYCKKHLTKSQTTIDHIISPSRGGLNTIENCCLSCLWCNNDKGILTKEEYYYKQLHNAARGIHPPE